jgi:hypothetical protein
MALISPQILSITNHMMPGVFLPRVVCLGSTVGCLVVVELHCTLALRRSFAVAA